LSFADSLILLAGKDLGILLLPARGLARNWHIKVLVIIATFKIAPLRKQSLKVLEILQSIQGHISAQPGCLSCEIYTEVGSGSTILFSEHWENEAALNEHIRSDIYLRVLSAAEFSCKAPEIRFYRVSDTQDMELIRRLRLTAGTNVSESVVSAGNSIKKPDEE
jgi:quinol monooxygenase YgiN